MEQRHAPTLGHVVWHLSNKWRVAVDRALHPLRLTHAPYAVLASLYGLSTGGAKPNQRELADFSGLDVMYVSKLVRALERDGLVRRTDHPDDPRAFQLVLTSRGARLTEEAAAVVRELYVDLLAPIGGPTSARATALMQTLDLMLQHAAARNVRQARPAAVPSKSLARVKLPRRVS